MEDYRDLGFEGSGETKKMHDSVSPVASAISENERGGDYRNQIVAVLDAADHSFTDREGDRGFHICGLCKKGFSSGNALGGHMRVHSQPSHAKKKIKILKPNVHASSLEESPDHGTVEASGVSGGYGGYRCSCCSKEFSSVKSLSGHMRHHPERNWKGIRPPKLEPLPPPLNQTSSSSEESTPTATQEEEHIYEEERGEEEKESQITSPTETVGGNDDQPRFVASWPKTGRRGRKTLVIDQAVQPDNALVTRVLCPTLLAADSLISLVRRSYSDMLDNQIEVKEIEDHDRSEKGYRASQLVNSRKRMFESSQFKNNSNYLLDMDEKGSWRLSRNTMEASNSSNRVHLEKVVGESHESSDAEDEAEHSEDRKREENADEHTEAAQNHKIETNEKKTANKKINRKPKSRASEAQSQKTTLEKNNVFECRSCGKTFATFQALGGHRSSHYKEKPTATPPVEETKESGEHAPSHQCNICFKTFPTGQALGGHKRRHWEAPPDSTSHEGVAEDSQTTAATAPLLLPKEPTQTHRKVLDFDLNEPYVMEEE